MTQTPLRVGLALVAVLAAGCTAAEEKRRPASSPKGARPDGM